MTSVAVTIPEEVVKKAQQVAEQQHISLDELMTRALIEKLSVAVQDPYLEDRAKRGKREAFETFLAQVPDVPPAEDDRP